jgi:hypothetical protein
MESSVGPCSVAGQPGSKKKVYRSVAQTTRINRYPAHVIRHNFMRSPRENDRSAEFSFWISAWAASLTL